MSRWLLVLLFACRPATIPGPSSPDEPDADAEAPDCAATACPRSESPTGPVAAAPECSASAECGADRACCSQRCARLADADRDCGACGVACSPIQFCSAGHCAALVLSAVCTASRAQVVLDGNVDDEAAAAAIGEAWAAACGKPVVNVAQADAIAGDGQPKQGPGTLAVFSGGAFFQRGLAYMDQRALTRVTGVESPPGTYTLRERGTNRALVTTTTAGLSAQHDYFVIEIAKEPTSNTVALLVWGMLAPGTHAGAAFVAARLASDRAAWSKAWYVYEWSDANGDAVADASDTYTFVASAP